MTVFQDNLLTSTYRDEAIDYVVRNVLSSRDLVFRPDIADIELYHHVLGSIYLRYRLCIFGDIGCDLSHVSEF